jgi:hypothetical protein
MTISAFRGPFVWTKIQADSGQKLEHILHRKELERLSGGTFWWGIGESKTKKIRTLLARDAQPTVVFSRMRTAPHRRDSNPDGVLLWEEYETHNGTAPLPPHVVVISRAHDRNGSLKDVYYALVCESEVGIPRSGGGSLDAGMLRNLGEGGRRIGASQITAVVEMRTGQGIPGLSYPITARATLVAPFSVRLTKPRLLTAHERHLLNNVSNSSKTADDWIVVAKTLRRTVPPRPLQLALQNPTQPGMMIPR